MDEKVISYLEEKSELTVRAFLFALGERIIDYFILKRVIYAFKVKIQKKDNMIFY